ncbi:hypothetical protein SSX86_009203 [Deinandra increscens subsp. villosa]|uniref:Uncharacterized protein n=1 Tax=Deinandra increscens subsp. villosa TaxID=3103831 RepID=A0AAP0DGW6_9ASTR
MSHPKTRSGITSTKPKNSGTKAVDRQRLSTSEETPQTKRVIKATDLEIQVARLQEELKKTKSQLSQSESITKQAHHEAEQAKKELAATTAKLHELWACEESRIHELRKISHDRDRAWETELQAVQKHLANAMVENEQLNIRLRKAAQAHEAQLKLSEADKVVEELETKLNESRESESRALEQLELTKSTVEEFGTVMAANAEMEGELRRLKVQTEQWRKAAEAAATMVLEEGGGGGGKFVESLKSFDYNDFNGKSNSISLEDREDEYSSVKKTNMLKKIGLLLKKGQK